MTYLLIGLFIIILLLLISKRKKRKSPLSPLDKITRSTEENEQNPKEVVSQRMQLLELELLRAGITLSAKQFVRLRLFTTLVLFLLFFLLTKNIIITSLVTFGWYVAPKFLLNFAKEKKKRILEAQIPIALSLIRNSVEAGFSFLQSLEVVAQEMESPISDEFARVLHENNIGKDLEVSLWNMVERCQSEELKLVVTAVLIQRQVGGNLGEIIDIILETIKDRIQIKGELRTLTSQGRLSAMVIASLPVVLGIVMTLINSTYMEPLYTTTFGQTLIGIAVFLEILGVYLISKIIKIDF